MSSTLELAGRSALKAAIAVFVVYSYGVLAAPDLRQKGALAVAASVAAIAAAIRALQVFAPGLLVSKWLGLTGLVAELVDSFAQTFVASLLGGFLSILAAPDFHTAKAVAVAAVIGAATAAVHAVQELLTKGSSPAPNFGLPQRR